MGGLRSSWRPATGGENRPTSLKDDLAAAQTEGMVAMAAERSPRSRRIESHPRNLQVTRVLAPLQKITTKLWRVMMIRPWKA